MDEHDGSASPEKSAHRGRWHVSSPDRCIGSSLGGSKESGQSPRRLNGATVPTPGLNPHHALSSPAREHAKAAQIRREAGPKVKPESRIQVERGLEVSWEREPRDRDAVRRVAQSDGEEYGDDEPEAQPPFQTRASHRRKRTDQYNVSHGAHCQAHAGSRAGQR